MIRGFITSYIDKSLHPHIYFYPGKDDNGRPYLRMTFDTHNIDYKYTKLDDGAFDYEITEFSINYIDCVVVDTIARKENIYKVRLRDGE